MVTLLVFSSLEAYMLQKYKFFMAVIMRSVGLTRKSATFMVFIPEFVAIFIALTSAVILM